MTLLLSVAGLIAQFVVIGSGILAFA
jgi:hypothetical protein